MFRFSLLLFYLNILSGAKSKVYQRSVRYALGLISAFTLIASGPWPPSFEAASATLQLSRWHEKNYTVIVFKRLHSNLTAFTKTAETFKKTTLQTQRYLFSSVSHCYFKGSTLINIPLTKYFAGDVVLCTLPLGVLKVAVAPNGQNQQNFTKFDPPLPDWKASILDTIDHSFHYTSTLTRITVALFNDYFVFRWML